MAVNGYSRLASRDAHQKQVALGAMDGTYQLRDADRLLQKSIIRSVLLAIAVPLPESDYQMQRHRRVAARSGACSAGPNWATDFLVKRQATQRIGRLRVE